MIQGTFCPRCFARVEPDATACPRCGTSFVASGRSGSPLVAAGVALLLVSVAAVAAIAFVSLPGGGAAPLSSTALATLAPGNGAGAAPSPSGEGSAGPSGSVGASAVATASASSTMEAARLDGNPWYIEHVVTRSSAPDVQKGDLATRIYDVEYACSRPPCNVTITSDDPDTIGPASENPFNYRDGAYTSSETYRERCVTPNGTVVARGYLVTLTTTIRVADAEREGGLLRATELAGSQVRTATAPGIGADRCPEWRVETATTGTRNVRPGIATDFVSSNWAGYTVEPTEGRVTHVRGSWRQPAIDCRGARLRHSGFWIGIDGFRSETVEQLGTAADCVNGRPRYYAWYEMYPAPMIPWDIEISPGDDVFATIDAEGGRFTMTLLNRTTEESETTTQSAPNVERSSAEWIAEPPSLCLGDDCVLSDLADFGRIRFDEAFASIDGGEILPPTSPSWSLGRHNIETEDGARVAETSTLSSDGTSFSVSWRPTP